MQKWETSNNLSADVLGVSLIALLNSYLSPMDRGEGSRTSTWQHT